MNGYGFRDVLSDDSSWLSDDELWRRFRIAYLGVGSSCSDDPDCPLADEHPGDHASVSEPGQ